jgi:hypothetical protein
VVPGHLTREEPDAVPDAVTSLLNRSGLQPLRFSAVLREQADSAASAAAARDGIISAFESGPLRLLGRFVADHPPADIDQTARLRVRMPGCYRIDQDPPERRKPISVICDGERLWRVYADRIADKPATPLPAGIALMIDLNWLLRGYRLGVSGPVVTAGREGVLVIAESQEGVKETRQGPLSNTTVLADRIDTIVDRRLGIALRQDWQDGGQLMLRTELTGVAEDVDQNAFLLEVPPGVRLIKDPGLLAEADMSALTAAGELAGGAAKSAAAFVRWLARSSRQ